MLIGIFRVNFGLTFTVDHEHKNVRFGRILVYVKFDLALRSFKHAALNCDIEAVSEKQ